LVAPQDLVNTHPIDPIRGVIVDDTRSQLTKPLVDIVQSLGVIAQVASNPGMALALHAVEPADVYLIDLEVREFDALALCRALREAPGGNHCAILGLSFDTGGDRLSLAHTAGIDDLLAKPPQPRDFGARLRLIGRIAALNRTLRTSLERAARTDVLTGLPNRRDILERLQSDWQASAGRQLPCSVIIIDLDHFKLLNDHRGHDAGDQVLEKVAGILRSSVRGVDFVGRLGGEEFAVICPGTDNAAARAMAESALDTEAHSSNASVRSTAQLVEGLAAIVLGQADPNG